MCPGSQSQTGDRAIITLKSNYPALPGGIDVLLYLLLGLYTVFQVFLLALLFPNLLTKGLLLGFLQAQLVASPLLLVIVLYRLLWYAGRRRLVVANSHTLAIQIAGRRPRFVKRRDVAALSESGSALILASGRAVHLDTIGVPRGALDSFLDQLYTRWWPGTTRSAVQATLGTTPPRWSLGLPYTFRYPAVSLLAVAVMTAYWYFGAAGFFAVLIPGFLGYAMLESRIRERQTRREARRVDVQPGIAPPKPNE